VRSEFEHTAEDIRELAGVARKNPPARAGYTVRGSMWWAIVVLAAAGLVVGVAHNTRHNIAPSAVRAAPVSPLPFVVGALILWGLIYVYLYLTRAKRGIASLKRMGLYQQQVCLDLSEAGVISVMEAIETRFRWDAFDRCIETDARFFLRVTQTRGFVVIPKRALHTDAAIGEVRRLLQTCLRDKISAFAVIPIVATASSART
jgi:hypothetical protein